MKKIYSKINKNELLHMVLKQNQIDEGRVDLIPSNNFLQCSTLKLPKGKTFVPHKHIWKTGKSSVIAQESWVVIKGSVKCIFYDLDDSILSEEILKCGDMSFTLQGGHNYLILEDDTLVYEFKTGPYEGQEFDKKFIL